MGEIIDIIKVILLSSVKFIFGPIGLAFYQQKFDYDFSLFEKLLYPVIGGMLGVFVFTYFGDQLFKLWHHYKHKVKKAVKKNEVFSEPTVDVALPVSVHYSYLGQVQMRAKKIFTPRNRRIVRVWNQYGLIGLAFLTPVLFSIPLGTIIATRFVHNKKKIFLYMFVSLVFWSFMITSVIQIREHARARKMQHEMIR